MQTRTRSNRLVDGCKWWHGAVLYQIYPRSFLDSNGDGIGDLPGITRKLDYVADLGVDGIWLSPFFTSPMDDFGYDVSDYCDVDPAFGTLADFDAMLDAAHQRGLKIVIDQVYSHSSDRHAWFAESRQNRDNAKSDWYVWADPKSDGSAPNNWLSVFGGPAWTWDGRRQQYYLHNFLPSQPDLNLHKREVRDALLDVARFWLDRGVDGFRLDAIHCAMHDLELRDNPASTRRPVRKRPYDFQEQRYNQAHPGVPAFLEEIRAVTDAYEGIFTVGEVGGMDPLPCMKLYTACDARLNTAYSFDFLRMKDLDARDVADVLSRWSGEPGEGWPSWAFSNHDAPRVASRWCEGPGHDRGTRLFALLQMSLRGNIFIYQGEELGLEQAEVPFERLRDPEALNNWPTTFGRDGARTPMPWQAARAYAGFSSTEPWLPVDTRHVTRSVDNQYDDPDSVLNFFRRVIQLRKSCPALMTGDKVFLESPPGILAFQRVSDDQTVLCVFNLSAEPAELQVADDSGLSVALSVGLDTAKTSLPSHLSPYSGFIATEFSE